MKWVWSGVRSDFPRLPQPVRFLRLFFLFVFFFWLLVAGFGLPSLSHSGFFEVGWLTCWLMCLDLLPGLFLVDLALQFGELFAQLR